MTPEDASFLSPSAQRGKQRPGERRDKSKGTELSGARGLGALPRPPVWATLPLCVLYGGMRIPDAPVSCTHHPGP